MICVVQKLPNYLQTKWREHACNMRQVHSNNLQFPDMVNFIAHASDTDNDPMYGRAAMTCGNNQHISSGSKQQHEQVRNRQQTTRFATQLLACPLCGKHHDLDHCEAYVSKTVEDRRGFLIENRLCFGCYGSGHMSKDCKHRKKCQHCQKRHPTGLHIDGFKLTMPEETHGS